jgi:hypothetical protein
MATGKSKKPNKTQNRITTGKGAGQFTNNNSGKVPAPTENPASSNGAKPSSNNVDRSMLKPPVPSSVARFNAIRRQKLSDERDDMFSMAGSVGNGIKGDREAQQYVEDQHGLVDWKR